MSVIGRVRNCSPVQCASSAGKEDTMGWITIVLAIMSLCGKNVNTMLAICAIITSVLSLYLAHLVKRR